MNTPHGCSIFSHRLSYVRRTGKGKCPPGGAASQKAARCACYAVTIQDLDTLATLNCRHEEGGATFALFLCSLQPNRIRREEGVEPAGVSEAFTIGAGIDAERSRDPVDFLIRRDKTDRKIEIQVNLPKDVQDRDENEELSLCAFHKPAPVRG